jgi:hypothetical protein
MYLKTSIALTLALSSAAYASDREHDSHEHGAATLDVVIDGAQMFVTFDSPWMNLVGFEHAPSTDEQRDAVANAQAQLEDGMLALGIDSGAGCTLQTTGIDSSMAMDDHGDEHGHDDHGDDHDDDHSDEHGHDEHDDEHGHDDHSDEHDDKHGDDHGDEHGHDHDATHSEISVNWAFTCENPDAVSTLALSLFDNFSGIETLSVQMAGPGGQSAQKVSADNANVNLTAVQ